MRLDKVRGVFWLLIALAALPAGFQAKAADVDTIDRYIRGYQFRTTYHERGRPIHGKWFVVQTYFCNSGRYLSQTSWTRTTVLENTERGGWQDQGRWKVERVRGQLGVRTVSDRGEPGFVPFQIVRGRPWIADGINVARTGRAPCR